MNKIKLHNGIVIEKTDEEIKEQLKKHFSDEGIEAQINAINDGFIVIERSFTDDGSFLDSRKFSIDYIVDNFQEIWHKQ